MQKNHYIYKTDICGLRTEGWWTSLSFASLDSLPPTLSINEREMICTSKWVNHWCNQAIIVHQWYIQAPGINRKNYLTKQLGGGQDNTAGTGCPPSHQWMNETWCAYPNELIAVANQAILIQPDVWDLSTEGWWTSHENLCNLPAGIACPAPPPHQWMKEKWDAHPNELSTVATKQL